MAQAEDPASVLESFVHDVANLPAEIAHLLEEIQAKDEIVQQCMNNVHQRQSSLEKHIKANGAKVKHPKEDQMSKAVKENFEKAQQLQDDKCALSVKANSLLERHIKRLDLKIRELQNEGGLIHDPSLPTLLHYSVGNLVDIPSSGNTGTNTPLHNFTLGQSNTSTTIANAASARMLSTAVHNANLSRATVHANPIAPTAAMASSASVSSGPGRQSREMSAGASDAKRRRIVGPGAIPIPASGLRQSSLGPGTPKASTPGSRAGSAGPRIKKPGKKIPPGAVGLRNKIKGTSKKAKKLAGRSTSSGTSGSDEEEESEDNVSSAQADGAAEDEDMDEAGDDEDENKLYCVCNNVSHGNMVACDNANCEREWFHWECVGLKEEPKGKWLCPDCKKKSNAEIKWAK